MGTWHETNLELPDKKALLQWLPTAMPQYEVGTRGITVILKAGTSTGLYLLPKKGKIKTGWAFGSFGLQIFVQLSFLAGILPGLILFGIIWSSVGTKVKQMEQEFATALASGGAQPAASALDAALGAPMGPSS